MSRAATHFLHNIVYLCSVHFLEFDAIRFALHVNDDSKEEYFRFGYRILHNRFRFHHITSWSGKAVLGANTKSTVSRWRLMQ